MVLPTQDQVGRIPKSAEAAHENQGTQHGPRGIASGKDIGIVRWYQYPSARKTLKKRWWCRPRLSIPPRMDPAGLAGDAALLDVGPPMGRGRSRNERRTQAKTPAPQRQINGWHFLWSAFGRRRLLPQADGPRQKWSFGQVPPADFYHELTGQHARGPLRRSRFVRSRASATTVIGE